METLPQHSVALTMLQQGSVAVMDLACLQMFMSSCGYPRAFCLRLCDAPHQQGAVQKKVEREARWAAAAQAHPTGRSDSSEEDQATYDLTANAATYNEGLHQLDASSCNILKESSTFISEPAPPGCEQQPSCQVREDTPIPAVITLVLPK